MLPLLLAAAAIPLTPQESADIRCVAVIGIAARALGDTAKANGRDYAVVVGADIMDRTGRTREEVANLMLAQGKDAVATRPAALEENGCFLRANARLAADNAATTPLPGPIR